MSFENPTDYSEFAKGDLLKALGNQGIPEVTLVGGEEASITARFPGDQELVFGLNENSTPFAFYTDEDGITHPYTKSEDKNKIATKKTWEILETLMGQIRENGYSGTIDLYSLVEQPEKREISQTFDEIFGESAEDVSALEECKAIVESLEEDGYGYFAVFHNSGMAHDHKVGIDTHPDDPRTFGVDQTGSFLIMSQDFTDVVIEIDDPEEFHCYESWKKLHRISELTFNRMQHPSALIIELKTSEE